MSNVQPSDTPTNPVSNASVELTRVQPALALLGRVLLAVIFLVSGFGKLTHPQDTAAYMRSHGMPAVQVGLVLAIVAELGGGTLLILGLFARVIAAILILFLAGATYYFHAFWAVPPEQAQNMMAHFMKNVAIIGGLLMVIACGPVAWALGPHRRKHRPTA